MSDLKSCDRCHKTYAVADNLRIAITADFGHLRSEDVAGSYDLCDACVVSFLKGCWRNG